MICQNQKRIAILRKPIWRAARGPNDIHNGWCRIVVDHALRQLRHIGIIARLGIIPIKNEQPLARSTASQIADIAVKCRTIRTIDQAAGLIVFQPANFEAAVIFHIPGRKRDWIALLIHIYAGTRCIDDIMAPVIGFLCRRLICRCRRRSTCAAQIPIPIRHIGIGQVNGFVLILAFIFNHTGKSQFHIDQPRRRHTRRAKPHMGNIARHRAVKTFGTPVGIRPGVPPRARRNIPIFDAEGRTRHAHEQTLDNRIGNRRIQ